MEEETMECSHCDKPLDDGDGLRLDGCAIGPEIVCESCWWNAVLPFDCLQCVEEVRT